MNHQKLQSVIVSFGFSILFMALLAIPFGLARADSVIRYAASTGTDSGDCSNSGSPCATIQYAVDQAAPGDEIRIAGGTYPGVSARGSLSQTVYITKNLILRGGYEPGAWDASDPAANPTTLDALGLGRVVYITGAISPTLKGLRLTNGDAGSNDGGGVYVYLQ